jgi:hypothetical protein
MLPPPACSGRPACGCITCNPPADAASLSNLTPPPPPSPLSSSGAVQAGGIAAGLWVFTSKVEAIIGNQALPAGYTVREGSPQGGWGQGQWQGVGR